MQSTGGADVDADADISPVAIKSSLALLRAKKARAAHKAAVAAAADEIRAAAEGATAAAAAAAHSGSGVARPASHSPSSSSASSPSGGVMGDMQRYLSNIHSTLTQRRQQPTLDGPVSRSPPPPAAAVSPTAARGSQRTRVGAPPAAQLRSPASSTASLSSQSRSYSPLSQQRDSESQRPEAHSHASPRAPPSAAPRTPLHAQHNFAHSFHSPQHAQVQHRPPRLGHQGHTSSLPVAHLSPKAATPTSHSVRLAQPMQMQTQMRDSERGRERPTAHPHPNPFIPGLLAGSLGLDDSNSFDALLMADDLHAEHDDEKREQHSRHQHLHDHDHDLSTSDDDDGENQVHAMAQAQGFGQRLPPPLSNGTEDRRRAAAAVRPARADTDSDSDSSTSADSLSDEEMSTSDDDDGQVAAVVPAASAPAAVAATATHAQPASSGLATASSSTVSTTPERLQQQQQPSSLGLELAAASAPASAGSSASTSPAPRSPAFGAYAAPSGNAQGGVTSIAQQIHAAINQAALLRNSHVNASFHAHTGGGGGVGTGIGHASVSTAAATKGSAAISAAPLGTAPAAITTAATNKGGLASHSASIFASPSSSVAAATASGAGRVMFSPSTFASPSPSPSQSPMLRGHASGPATAHAHAHLPPLASSASPPAPIVAHAHAARVQRQLYTHASSSPPSPVLVGSPGLSPQDSTSGAVEHTPASSASPFDLLTLRYAQTRSQSPGASASASPGASPALAPMASPMGPAGGIGNGGGGAGTAAVLAFGGPSLGGVPALARSLSEMSMHQHQQQAAQQAHSHTQARVGVDTLRSLTPPRPAPTPSPARPALPHAAHRAASLPLRSAEAAAVAAAATAVAAAPVAASPADSQQSPPSTSTPAASSPPSSDERADDPVTLQIRLQPNDSTDDAVDTADTDPGLRLVSSDGTVSLHQLPTQKQQQQQPSDRAMHPPSSTAPSLPSKPLTVAAGSPSASPAPSPAYLDPARSPHMFPSPSASPTSAVDFSSPASSPQFVHPGFGARTSTSEFANLLLEERERAAALDASGSSWGAPPPERERRGSVFTANAIAQSIAASQAAALSRRRSVSASQTGQGVMVGAGASAVPAPSPSSSSASSARNRVPGVPVTMPNEFRLSAAGRRVQAPIVAAATGALSSVGVLPSPSSSVLSARHRRGGSGMGSSAMTPVSLHSHPLARPSVSSPTSVAAAAALAKSRSPRSLQSDPAQLLQGVTFTGTPKSAAAAAPIAAPAVAPVVVTPPAVVPAGIPVAAPADVAAIPATAAVPAVAPVPSPSSSSGSSSATSPLYTHRMFENFLVLGCSPSAELLAQNHVVWTEPAKVLLKFPHHSLVEAADVADFAFPASALLRRIDLTQSNTGVHSILYGQRQFVRGEHCHSFVLKTTHNIENVNESEDLYGVCVQAREMAALVGADGRVHDVSCPISYCILSRYPFFELHQAVILQILMLLHLKRVKHLAQLADAPSPAASPTGSEGSGGSGPANLVGDAGGLVARLRGKPLGPHQVPACVALLKRYYDTPPPPRGGSLLLPAPKLLLPIQFQRPNAAPGKETRTLIAQWCAPLAWTHLGPESLVDLLEILLREFKVVVVDSNLAMLSAAVMASGPLLHPLKWSGVFLPILPNKMHEFLEAPVPILVGVASLPEHMSHTHAAEEDLVMWFPSQGRMVLPRGFKRLLPAPNRAALVAALKPHFAEMRRLHPVLPPVKLSAQPGLLNYSPSIEEHAHVKIMLHLIETEIVARINYVRATEEDPSCKDKRYEPFTCAFRETQMLSHYLQSHEYDEEDY